MRRAEFPIGTLVSLIALAMAMAWQVQRALEFKEGLKAVDHVSNRPFVGRDVERLKLPDLDAKPKAGCITVFLPPRMQQRSRVFAPDFFLSPRPRFTLLQAGEQGVDLQVNREGARVVGLRLGGYFDFQGERYYLIDVKEDQVTLRQASNHRRFSALSGVVSRSRPDHHL